MNIHGYLTRHRRKVAIGVSLGLHGLVIAFFLISIAPDIIGGGNHGDSFGAGSGSGFSVDLVSARDAMPDALKVKQPEQDDAAEPTDFTPTEVAKTTTDIAAADAQPLAQLSEAAPENDAQTGGAGQGGQSAGVNDDLWKQIEPCWRRLADRGTRGAMLRVSFSPLGNIAKADTASDAPSDAKAQTIAHEALAECGPYVAAGSREDVTIAFPAP